MQICPYATRILPVQKLLHGIIPDVSSDTIFYVGFIAFLMNYGYKINLLRENWKENLKFKTPELLNS